MHIKELNAKIIVDSRNEKTISVSVRSEHGIFTASSPSGKSIGKHEKPSYRNNIENDIKEIKNLKIDFLIDNFSDLEKVEKLVKGRIGANSIFALESAILKAIAFEKGKEIWQVINEKAKKMPFPLGNCVEGGSHSHSKLKPDFQEFLVIPKAEKFIDNVFLMKQMHKNIGEALKAKNFTDENAWQTEKSNEEVLEIFDKLRKEMEIESDKKIEIGIDVASSSFYSNLYEYKNPEKHLDSKEQLEYISELIKKYNLFYVEDAFDEEYFSDFKKLREKTSDCLIVSDDLTTSNLQRFVLALRSKAIDAIILKPNQIGSLIEISKIVKLAKKLNIKIIFSHRSGETNESIISDLAFGFQADFVKFGIVGKEREVKLKRLIEIERQISL